MFLSATDFSGRQAYFRLFFSFGLTRPNLRINLEFFIALFQSKTDSAFSRFNWMIFPASPFWSAMLTASATVNFFVSTAWTGMERPTNKKTNTSATEAILVRRVLYCRRNSSSPVKITGIKNKVRIEENAKPPITVRARGVVSRLFAHP